jgi:glycosyltransferase involved in cell wall biosynthesis
MSEAQSPSVSVIVRTLGSRHLSEALESLAGQSRKDFEVVIVDMSAGSVGPLLARFSSQLDHVRHLEVGRPLTQPVALNVGILDASAPLIAILDDNNRYDSGHLELLISSIESSRADYVYCGVRQMTFGPERRPIACREVSVPYRFEDLILRNYIEATGLIYRKALWEKVGGYDERFDVFEDWDFVIKAGQAGKLVHVPTVSGESHEFIGAAEVNLLTEPTWRCLAGIYWKHRRLYRGAMFFRLGYAWGEHWLHRPRASTGLSTWSIAGWQFLMLSDLVAWWRFSRAWGKGEFALTTRSRDAAPTR